MASAVEAILFWLFDFPQLEVAHRPEDADDATVGAELLDQFEVVTKIAEVVEEICEGALPVPPPTSAGDAWTAIHGLMCDQGLAVEDLNDTEIQTTEGRHKLLSSLLCHALSGRCERQGEYVGRIMAFRRPDVRREIMRILQENAHQCEDNASLASFECEGDMNSASELYDQECTDTSFEETIDLGGVEQKPSRKESDLIATTAKLQQQLKESQQKEMDLTSKADEDHSNHRAEMLQVESEYLKTIRDLEDKYTAEVSEQKRELETLRDCEASAKQTKEENSRLRDELDVLECSKEKLAFTEEQLRKCREKIELIGDAHDALQREEKAHAEAVDKCVQLEHELAQLKPLKRQLEEYRVRATDAEVALSECRDDLRRIKEKSSGLEGANRDLQRGAHRRQAEADNLQKRLQEEGGKSRNGCTAIGVGMSELNPELMEELKTLRSEYARLKEFESKREVDSVQRLEESCNDAKRLSESYKENYFATKSNLEDTQQLLDESKAREAKLRKEVVELTEKCNQLREEMKEERKKAHKAALEAEGAHQSEKKSILEKARQDLQTLEVNLTQKIEAEREQHQKKMAQKDAQRVQLENNLIKQLKNEQEKSSNSLRTTKEQAEKKMAELEKSNKMEIEKLRKEKDDKFATLKTKGEGMLRGERQKRKDLERSIATDPMEVQVTLLTEEYEKKIEEMRAKMSDVMVERSADGRRLQTADERAWKLEDQLRKVESELATAKLALQRKGESSADSSAGPSVSSKKRYQTNGKTQKENTPNNINELVDLTSKDKADAAGEAPECQQS